jgi:hypothetical protein
MRNSKGENSDPLPRYSAYSTWPAGRHGGKPAWNMRDSGIDFLNTLTLYSRILSNFCLK